MAYLVVLAKDTAQVAKGKEYIPGPARAGYRGFFPEMRAEMRNFRAVSGAAKAFFAAGPVDTAMPGT